ERVRTWLKQNSLAIIGGLVLGLAAIGGGKWWMQQQHQERVATGEAFDGMVAAIQAGNLEQAKTAAEALGETNYAPLAALALAKGQLDAGDRDAAIATLRAAHSDEPGLATVIRHRLARLLVDAGQGEEALSLLAQAEEADALETRGDAYFALGREDEARAQYEQALAKLDVAAPQRGLLEL